MTGATEISTNQGIIAGRDVYLGDQYVVQDTLYFEPSLKEVEPPGYVSPPKAQELLRLLIQQRLLVLAGSGFEEKGRVARHIAWLLREQFPLQPSSGHPLRIREWYRSSDPQKIETAFHPLEETLLLLPQVQPHHLGYRLEDLAYFLATGRHYVILTTETGIAQWRAEGLAGSGLAWCEISWESYYGRDLLEQMLAEKIAKVAELLPEGVVVSEDGGIHSCRIGGLSLSELAAGLKNPERFDPFMGWLLAQKTPPAGDMLKKQIDSFAGEARILDAWYQALDERYQMLAIGLLFFEGLPDDQVFAGLETLVDDAWRLSDPQLRQYDYRDLDRLSACFGLVDAGADGMRIEMVSRSKRRELMQTVWRLQRRKVLATLPALTAMIKRSALEDRSGADEESAGLAAAALLLVKNRWSTTKREAPQPAAAALVSMRERELYDSGPKARRFRDAMTETLAQVGLLSLESVEAFLLELIIQGPPSVRKLVAKTLASWRATENSAEFFTLLHQWWAEGCESDSSREWISALAKKGTDPFAEIRATVALAVGYGMQYDPPNQLSSPLISLFEVLIRDPFPKVRANFLELTLPIALAWHLRQLEDLLRTKVELEEDLMHPIAFGIAMAVSIDTPETLELLNRWLTENQSEEPQPSPQISDRERWISTLALAYGYIQLEPDETAITPDQILTRLQAILYEEEHPFVRRHVLLAIGLQAIRNFALVSPTLDQLASTVKLVDREFLIAILRQAYLHQRQQMEGGDGRIFVGELSYAVWIQTERPLTPLETLLFDWIEDGDPVARQLAVEAFVALQTTELERSERNLSIRWDETAVSRLARHTGKARRLRWLNPLGYMAVFLAVPGNWKRRAVLQPLLAELLTLQRRAVPDIQEVELRAQALQAGALGDHEKGKPRRGLMERARARRLGLAESMKLLGRWAHYPGHEIRELVDDLGRALFIYRMRWLIVALVVFAGGFLRSFGVDMTTNYAFWLHDLPYQSTIERQLQVLADHIEGVEPEIAEFYS